mmetsp:Transcript_22324/g.33432  ORF Transcript_22324/g.33432 Transcript_22324/m.33432 type:complete len:129 (-) Transcript_22324:377-763(-)
MLSPYQQGCLTQPIASSVIMGGVFSALDVAMGNGKLTPRGVASYAGFIYAYNAIQCPMEEIHGRRSALHNVFAGGLMGYFGVQRGHIGIPFVDPTLFYRYPSLKPQTVAFAVYGAMGGALAMVGGKPI